MEEKQLDVPKAAGPPWYQQIKKGLAIAAQVIIAAPVRLPGKLVQAATYVSLLIGLLDGLDNEKRPNSDPPDAAKGGINDAS